MRFVLAAVVLCSALAWGQQCPLTLDDFHESFVVGQRYSERMLLRTTNAGSKDIAAVDFDITFVDRTLTEHAWFEKFEWGNSRHPLKQGKEWKMGWHRPIGAASPYEKIHVIKILYSDDSAWMNDGSCKEVWVKHYLKNHKPGA
jgi:hypothetical protein